MKKIKYFFAMIITLMLVIFSCQDQNDLHNVWLEDGERNYVGKIDSLYAFGGNERIEFQIYLSDPRVKSLNISWVEFGVVRETKVLVPDHEINEPFSIIVGESEDILENEYTFTFVSDDGTNVPSVPFQSLGKVFGSKYQESLTNRVVTGFELVDQDIYLDFSSALNEDDQGIELTYNNGTEDLVLNFTAEELDDRIFLETPDFNTSISYSTVYQPFNSIDTFKAEPIIPSIEKQENIALGKLATASGILRAGFEPVNIVDGSFSTRWLNESRSGNHWLEIDLEGAFPVEKIEIHFHEKQEQMENGFTLEALVNGTWQILAENVTETEDGNPLSWNTYRKIYAGDDIFSASKIRYSYSTTAAGQFSRMYQFEVYSTVKIQ